jgi:hypothetical protein
VFQTQQKEGRMDWEDSILSNQHIELYKQLVAESQILSRSNEEISKRKVSDSSVVEEEAEKEEEDHVSEQELLLIGYRIWLNNALDQVQSILDNIDKVKELGEQIKAEKRMLTNSSQQMNAHVQSLIAQRVKK